MLPSTRLPSATTYGRVAKLSSSSTILAAARVAPLPDPIATPRSARVSASTSLMPSPVIATVWPRDWSAVTKICFWRGLTRPNTELPSSASATAASSGSGSSAPPASPLSPPVGRERASTG